MHDHRISIRRFPRTRDVAAAALAAAGIVAAIVSTVHTHAIVAESQEGRCSVVASGRSAADGHATPVGPGASARWCAATRASVP